MNDGSVSLCDVHLFVVSNATLFRTIADGDGHRSQMPIINLDLYRIKNSTNSKP